MDGDGPGGLISQLNALALRSPRELFAFMATLTREQLSLLTPYLPKDCTCGACPDHPGAMCLCPCPHVRAAAAEDWPLCVEAVAYLLWLRRPSAYPGPIAMGEPSHNTNPDMQVAVMAERFERGESLWHPLDWIRLGLDGVDRKLGRQAVRLRNGADAVGDLVLEGADD